MGYALPLDNPQTYNEKLQWLKLYHRCPEYTKMVDKAEAKKYAANIIGEEHIIPTLAVYDRVEDINFEALPNQFVLKCTHDSGGIVICKDKTGLDKKAALAKLKKGLSKNYYFQNREWPYKNVKPRIIAEQYMTEVGGAIFEHKNVPVKELPSEDEKKLEGELNDYKWFCFSGEPKAMFIATDRFNKEEETKFDFYDMDFNHLPFTNGHPNSTRVIKKPLGFEIMKELAEKLSKGIPHVRIDFYDINGQIYFGEMTFFHWSGMVPFEPKNWDKLFGDWITLPDQHRRDRI